MSIDNLTDLEICKRIADIEELNPHMSQCNKYVMVEVDCMNSVVIRHTEYNPLTDDALCFSLLKKFDIDLLSPYRPNGDVNWEAQLFTKDNIEISNIYDINPNKAICLAIIEAHNG